MRNIKLTETEWKYINDALGFGTISLCDSWEIDGVKFSHKEFDRRLKILQRADYKIATAKKDKS